MTQRVSPEPAEVAARVVAHYRAMQRDLPWRRGVDPYATWVSEIMLQQTRVAAVVPYFERWLARFPTVTALAEAPLDDVLGHWAGLGYYSRARNLHKGAREVLARYGGELPAAAEDLQSLPGIGRYTAGAISSIAFGRRAPLVDGNVARVLARFYVIDDDIKSSSAQKRLWALADELVPADAPGDFNQGLMELGATVCTPTRPACIACPLQDMCAARAQGRQTELPVMPARKRRQDKPLLELHAAWVERDGMLLMARRRQEGLYGGLWELPAAVDISALQQLVDCAEASAAAPVWEHHQELSHRRLVIVVHVIGAGQPSLGADHSIYETLAWQPIDPKTRLGISSATAAIIVQYTEQRGWNSTNKPLPSSKKPTRNSSRASRSSATTPRKKTSTTPRDARPRGSMS